MTLDTLTRWGADLGPWFYLVAGIAVFAEAGLLAGVVIPGETALLVAGLAAQHGWISLPWVIVVAFAAAVLGDSTGYEVGRRWGPAIRRSRLGRRIGEQRWESAQDFLRRHGPAAVLLGRFTALLRALTPGMAGMVAMPYWRRFLPWNVAGAAVWAPACVLLGYTFSASLAAVGSYLTYGPLAVLVLAAVGFAVVRTRRRAHPSHTGSSSDSLP
jgi:membrane protein DedA with SNARE-associated domain